MQIKGSLKEMIIEITLSFPGNFGRGTITSDTSVFIRPFRLLIEEGKDIGKINYLFYQEKNYEGKQISTYTFGALCYTLGKRLLFFPGLIKRKILWWFPMIKNFIPPEGLVDHFTIESDFKSWHITTLVNKQKEKRKRWLPSFKLLEIQPNLYFWFGLSIQNANLLELTPKEVKWPLLQGSYEDLRRKEVIFKKSREGAKFHILKLPENKKRDTFLHFDVLVDKRKFKWFRTSNLKSVVPFKEPCLMQEIQPNLQFIARVHKVKLKGFKGQIIIGVSQHQGPLRKEIIITIPKV